MVLYGTSVSQLLLNVVRIPKKKILVLPVKRVGEYCVRSILPVSPHNKIKHLFCETACFLCVIRTNRMHCFALILFRQLTSICLGQVHCSPSGGTFLYVQQLLSCV